MDVFGLFAKHPQPGRVKTRLAKSLGDELVAELYAAFVDDLLDRFSDVADRRILAFAPNEPASKSYFAKRSSGRFDLWPQPEGDLGSRMTAFFDDAFNAGATRVMLIGSDSPTLPMEFVQLAFDLLAKAECVIGPATDGGYYLIGMQRPIPEVFRDIAWSGPDVLQQTVARLTELQIRPAELPAWFDVDTLDDLSMLRSHLQSLRSAGSAEIPERTANWLDRHTAAIDSLL